MDYDRVLFVKNEVFLYRIPPLQSNRGYRAADWGLDSPIWTGRLRIIAKGDELMLKLEDRNTGDLFAKCPVDSFPGIAVESVLDSSRYFVIRLMSDDGRTMFMGMGFAERSDSFDFNVTLQDHFKSLKQEQDAKDLELKLSSEPALDLGFKDGQSIRLNLNTRRTTDDPATSKLKTNVCQTDGKSNVGLLPPPPAPSVSRNRGNRGVPQLASSIQNSTVLTSSNQNPISVSPKTDLLTDIFGSS